MRIYSENKTDEEKEQHPEYEVVYRTDRVNAYRPILTDAERERRYTELKRAAEVLLKEKFRNERRKENEKR